MYRINKGQTKKQFESFFFSISLLFCYSVETNSIVIRVKFSKHELNKALKAMQKEKSFMLDKKNIAYMHNECISYLTLIDNE